MPSFFHCFAELINGGLIKRAAKYCKAMKKRKHFSIKSFETNF